MSTEEQAHTTPPGFLQLALPPGEPTIALPLYPIPVQHSPVQPADSADPDPNMSFSALAFASARSRTATPTQQEDDQEDQQPLISVQTAGSADTDPNIFSSALAFASASQSTSSPKQSPPAKLRRQDCPEERPQPWPVNPTRPPPIPTSSSSSTAAVPEVEQAQLSSESSSVVETVAQELQYQQTDVSSGVSTQVIKMKQKTKCGRRRTVCVRQG